MISPGKTWWKVKRKGEKAERDRKQIGSHVIENWNTWQKKVEWKIKIWRQKSKKKNTILAKIYKLAFSSFLVYSPLAVSDITVLSSFPAFKGYFSPEKVTKTMNNSESETMETAIELASPVPQELTTWQKVLNVFYVTTMVMCSEVRGELGLATIWKSIDIFFENTVTLQNALTIYILLHWLLACASHISYSEEETTAFVSFIYFMATLIAFLSIMSHVSGLLIPLFLFCVSLLTRAHFLILSEHRCLHPVLPAQPYIPQQPALFGHLQ